MEIATSLISSSANQAEYINTFIQVSSNDFLRVDLTESEDVQLSSELSFLSDNSIVQNTLQSGPKWAILKEIQ